MAKDKIGWVRIDSQLPKDERGNCDDCHGELPARYWVWEGNYTLCPECFKQAEAERLHKLNA